MDVWRRLSEPLAVDLRRKMVLLSGPRQCGKTTLALGLVEHVGGAYYSWDVLATRLAIQKRELDAGLPPLSWTA